MKSIFHGIGEEILPRTTRTNEKKSPRILTDDHGINEEDLPRTKRTRSFGTDTNEKKGPRKNVSAITKIHYFTVIEDIFLHGFFKLVLIILIIFIAAGCMEPDEVGDLNGTWSTFYDSYMICLENNLLVYDDGGWGTEYSGTILDVIEFNDNKSSGIIFIKYINKPTDFSTETQPAGDYIGIYFRNLTFNIVELSTPTEEYASELFRTPAKATLEEAKLTFTVDTVGDYISYWGTYIKQ